MLPSLPSAPPRLSRGNWGGKHTRSSAWVRKEGPAGTTSGTKLVPEVVPEVVPARPPTGDRPGTWIAFTREITCGRWASCEGPWVTAPVGSVGRWSTTGWMSDAVMGCVDGSPACPGALGSAFLPGGCGGESVGAIVALTCKCIRWPAARCACCRGCKARNLRVSERPELGLGDSAV
eukprot:scaffold86128_cov54-Phaeocystis_antarctica.AAC.1